MILKLFSKLNRVRILKQSTYTYCNQVAYSPYVFRHSRSIRIACAAVSCGAFIYLVQQNSSSLALPSLCVHAASKNYNRTNFNPVADVVEKTGSAVVCIETANAQLMRSYR